MTQEQMRNLNTIVETYGNDAQEDMAIEECSELIKAILKFRRSDEKTAEMRDMDYDPYVMVYDKQHTKGGDTVRLLQRYVNNRKIFKTIKRFEDYNPRMG